MFETIVSHKKGTRICFKIQMATELGELQDSTKKVHTERNTCNIIALGE